MGKELLPSSSETQSLRICNHLLINLQLFPGVFKVLIMVYCLESASENF